MSAGLFVDASDSLLAIIEETDWGTTPSTPAFKRLRFTGEGLGANVESIKSNEIDPDASVKDLVQSGGGATGDFNFELSFGAEFDLILELAMRGDFDAATQILKAGSTKKSATIEKKLSNGTDDYYFRYAGSRVNSLALNITADQIIGGTVAIQGKSESLAAAIISGATYAVPNTNPVMSVSNVRAIVFVGFENEVVFSDMSFTLNNNLRTQRGFSTATTSFPDLDAKGIGMGQREVTGNLTAFFSNSELYTKFISGGEFSLSFVLSDGTNGYCVTFPRVKFQTAKSNAGGNNSDVQQAMTWQATKHTSIGTDMLVFKLPLAALGLTVTAEGDPLLMNVAGEYVLASGTAGETTAVYVRRDGMFVLKYVSTKWYFQQVGGDKYYGCATIDGTYTGETGYTTGGVPTVAVEV